MKNNDTIEVPRAWVEGLKMREREFLAKQTENNNSVRYGYNIAVGEINKKIDDLLNSAKTLLEK